MFRLFECCALSFFERFVLSFSLKIERFVSDSAEIWICGLYIEKVKPEYANSIKILHIDDICKSGENHDKLSSHYAKFREKYLEY